VTALQRALKQLVERPMAAYGQHHAAWLEEQKRNFGRMLSASNVARAALSTRVGTTPHDVVLREGTMSLLRYHRQTPATQAEPVVFCYALVNRPYILDLQPGKSVVEHYLARGFEVYLIDWGVPALSDRHLTLEDYVCSRLGCVIDHVLAQHAVEKLHLLGYCMGGTISAMFTALRPQTIKTLTLLAAPIDFSGQRSLINLWIGRKQFPVDAFIEAHGNCPGWFLQLSFLYTKPVQNLLEKYIALYEQVDDPRFVANYVAIERWTNDNIPVAGETFRRFVKDLYQGNQLVQRELHLGDRRVDLGRIECPLLLLTASNDHLVDPSSTNSIKAHVGSQDIKQMMIEAGHVGLVVSGKAHKAFWPEATQWLAARSEEVRHGRSN
jgi:polyhydroxyalkanoate synthase